jgi:hypothetical protein
LIARLAALEHSLGDITGAIAGQSEKATPPAAEGATQDGRSQNRECPGSERARSGCARSGCPGRK